MVQDRDLDIDVVKGVAMLCIIAGHLGVMQINCVVFIFHVPIFFLISGYLFKNSDYTIIKYGRSLISAYLITVVSLFLLTSIKGLYYSIINESSFNILGYIKYWLLAALYGSGGRVDFCGFNFPVIGAVWFLLALLWGVLFLRLILRIFPKGILAQCIGVFIVALVGWFSTKYIWLPLSIQSGCLALVYLFIGYKIRGVSFSLAPMLFFIPIFLYALYLSYTSGTFQCVVDYNLPNGIFDILAALAGSYMVYNFCKIMLTGGGEKSSKLVW